MNCCSEEVELWLIFFHMWVNYMHLSMQKISWTCEFVRCWIQSLWNIEHILITRQTTCRAHTAHTWMYHYMLSCTKTHRVESITIHYFCSKCHAVAFLRTSSLCMTTVQNWNLLWVSHARVIPGLPFPNLSLSRMLIICALLLPNENSWLGKQHVCLCHWLVSFL